VTVTDSGGNTAVIDAGASDSYSVVLSAGPLANVVVTPAPGAQLSTTPATLTFTTVNWATPQMVTVNAVNDRTVEGGHGDTITASAAGGGYDGVPVATVNAAISNLSTATSGVQLNPVSPSGDIIDDEIALFSDGFEGP